MPIVAAVIVALVVTIRVAVRLILELGRRILRAYRTGYAIVPDDTAIASTVSQPDRSTPLWAARDPVYLDGLGADAVVQVHDVRGARARARDVGMFWRCKSFVVGSVFPGWAALGPNGSDVLHVISSVWAIPVDRLEHSAYATRRRNREAVLSKDTYRATIGWKVDRLVEWTVMSRLDQVVAEGQEGLTPEETRTLANARKSPAWDSASAVIADAAIGAALADELPAEVVTRLAADWVDLVEPDPNTTISGVSRTERMRKAVGAVPAIVGDHPTLAALLTCAVLGVAVTISPNLAGLLVVGLVMVFLLMIIRDLPRVGRRIVRRGRGLRPRRPDPKDWLGRPPSSSRLRGAMDSIGDGPQPVLLNRLIRLLTESTVWVGLEGPAPASPERDLDWRRRTGQPLPLAIAIGDDGQRLLPCFTDPHRHRASRGHTHIDWTTPLPFPDLIRLAQDRAVDVIVVDPFRTPATTISKEAFPAFLPHDEHVNDEPSAEVPQ